MIVAVGPVPSESVIAYTQLAREKLVELADDPRSSTTLTPDLQQRFDALHAEWERLAASRAEFVWHSDLDIEEAAWVTHGFFRLVEIVAETGVESPESLRAASRPFYRALVTGLLDALEREHGAQSGFACNLRVSWPFMTDV